MKNQGTVVAFGGGGMKAVFGAGLAYELERANVQPHLAATVGSSAGALNAVSLLTGNTREGLQTFLDFVGTKSVNEDNVLPFLRGHVSSRMLGHPHKPEKHIMDVHGVLKVAHQRGLDLDALRKQAVDCFVRVTRYRTGRSELVDMRTHPDPEQMLRATILFRPYCVDSSHGDPMDGAIADPVGTGDLVRRFPEQKIVAVVNDPHADALSLKTRISSVLCGLLSMDWRLLRTYFNRPHGMRSVFALAEKLRGRVLAVCPPPDYPVGLLTRDPAAVRTGYEQGRRSAEGVLKFIGA